MYQKSYTRVDIVWDIHQTKLTDIRWAKVAESSTVVLPALIIKNRKDFVYLRMDENNTELLSLLSHQ